MRREIVKCDKCGKDITPTQPIHLESSHIDFRLWYYQYPGLLGEDFDLDLCYDCSKELSNMINDWLKTGKKEK